MRLPRRIRWFTAALILVQVFVVPELAGAHRPPSRNAVRRHIAQRARDRLGAGYCWSGERRCFDCSGLTYRVYRGHGAHLPRGTDWQWRARKRDGWRTKWRRRELHKGDLIFFENTYKTGISHVGIYISRGRFIHAEDEEAGVVWDSLRSSDYWRRHFKAGVRPRRFRAAFYR